MSPVLPSFRCISLLAAVSGCASSSSGPSIRLAKSGDDVTMTDTEGRRFLCTGGTDYARLERGVTQALFGERSADVVAIGRDAGYTCVGTS